MGWIPVSEKKPAAGRNVLAFYRNDFDMIRRVRAFYTPKNTIEADSDEDGFEYDEKTDCYYLPEGWYESNEHEDCHWMIDNKVTFWMPLPEPPDDRAQTFQAGLDFMDSLR